MSGEVITGPMFSGKTEELLRRVLRATIAGQKIQAFKSAIDSRGGETILSRSGHTHQADLVSKADEILKLVDHDTDVVAIDEAQFFDKDVIDVVQRLTFLGKRVIVAGLDMDYQGKPFGPMPKLMAIARRVDKLTAICTICKLDASFSHKLVDDDALILVDDGESKRIYEPRCFQHK